MTKYDELSLHQMQLEIRTSVPPPKQCLKCFRFGHELVQCYENARVCEHCAGDRDDHAQPCEKKAHCANCGSSRHSAMSRHCFALHKACRINIVATAEDVDFGTAKRFVDEEIEDCQSRGMSYVEEFPLSTRYFPRKSRNSVNSTGRGSPGIGCLKYSSNQPQTTNLGSREHCKSVNRSPDFWNQASGQEPDDYTGEIDEEDYDDDDDEFFGDHNGDFFESPEQVASNGSYTGDDALYRTLPRSSQRIRTKSSLLEIAVNEDSLPLQDSSDESDSCDWSSLSDSICTECVTTGPLDPTTVLIDVQNRYSNMVLRFGNVFYESDTVGFQSFLQSNIISSTFCWKRPTENFIESSFVSEDSTGSLDDRSAQIHLNSARVLEGCTDLNAAYRCKQILQGRTCDGTCDRSHRLPKDDGVQCILQRFGQCYQGRKCNFLHDESSDDDCGSSNTDDTYGTSTTTTTTSTTTAISTATYSSSSSSDEESDDDHKRYLSTVMSVGHLLGRMNLK